MNWGEMFNSAHSKYNMICSRISAFTLKEPGFIFLQPVSQISEVEKKQTEFSSLLQKPQSFGTAFLKWNGELSLSSLS